MIIVFSDLDGTLLDHNNYNYDQAMVGIDLLKEKKIPLVLVSSKTYFEMNEWREEFKLDSPFIFENGAGIAFPAFSIREIKLLGERSAVLLDKIPLLRSFLNQKIKTFDEMSVDEIVSKTGLNFDMAEAAKKRMASMPFLLEKDLPDSEIFEINKKIKFADISITRGGRFYHLMSNNVSKGNAIKYVIDKINKKGERVITMGIGDSLNDAPMLEKVDYPFIVKKHDNSYFKADFNVSYTDSIGPAGFTEAVSEFLVKVKENL